MHNDPEKEFKGLTLHYIITSHNEKKEKKCTLYPLRGRSDFSFRTKKDPGQFASDSILLLPGGEPLTAELATEIRDTKELSTGHVLEIVLIDSRWKKTNGILWSLPPIRRVSLEGYVTGAKRKEPPPPGGLASIEALFMASLLFGKPDFTLLSDYRFRESFFTLNGLKSE